MTVLMQLILLQDWQRVLIRARLFGVEVTQTCTINMFESIENDSDHKNKYRVLPLHVACVLDPPPQVVEALLQQSKEYDANKKKKKEKKKKQSQHENIGNTEKADEQRDDDAVDDDGEEHRMEHIPPLPLSLAMVPVELVQRKTKKKKKKKKESRSSKRSSRTKKKSKRSTAMSSGKFPEREDDEELLVWQQGSSSVEGISPEQSSLLENRLANNGSITMDSNHLYDYSVDAVSMDPSLVQDSKGTFSPENSIGDIDSLNDESFYSTLDERTTCSESTDSPIFEDTSMDEEDDAEMVASMLGSFLEKEGVVLQLTASGKIQPLPLPKKEPEEWSTIDPKPSGASSSITHTLSQQSSMSSTASVSNNADITFKLDHFLGTNANPGIHGQLLAIHIACLYKASPAALRILLSAHPEGALTAVHGMLPIHLIAANWKLPPLPTASQSHLGFTPDGVTSSMVYSELNRNENAVNKVGSDKRDRLQALLEAVPESLMAKSICHDLRPVEYVQNLLDSKHPDSLGRGEETPMFFLENCEKDYHRKCFKVTTGRYVIGLRRTKKIMSLYNILIFFFWLDLAISFFSSNMDLKAPVDCERTNSNSTETSTTVTLASTTSESAGSKSLSFLDMLQQGRWNDAMTCLELDHHLAKEWHYGIDKHNPITNEPCTLWKRLPLHIVCSGVISNDADVIPLCLVQLLIQANPEGLRAVDPHTGMVPLHLACRSSGSPTDGSGGKKSPTAMASIMLHVIRIALKAFPHSTKVVDVAGRLPLHHAIMVGAPISVVELLVHQDPGSVLSPDQEGNTPLSYAPKVYPTGDPVMSLLELAWL